MKRSLETTITQKGQVTVPVEIRRKLGLKAKDKVRFEIDGEVVRLRPVPRADFRKGYGAVSPCEAPEDFVRVREQVELDIALDVSSEAP